MLRLVFAGLLVLVASLSPAAWQPATGCDLLIAGGRIVDGTGAPWFAGDVCIVGERIAAVGREMTSAARRRVDASGLVVAPGFIDMLGQSEYWVLRDNRVASKIMQGITDRADRRGQLQQRSPCECAAPPPVRRDVRPGEGAGLGQPRRLPARARSRSRPPSTSARSSARAACATRSSVAKTAPRSPAELEEWRRRWPTAMEAGAFGLSTSLQYVPDRFARTDELVALARVAGRFGGSYITHQRSEADEIDDSLDEVFRIAREAGRARDDPSPEDGLQAELGPHARGAAADRAGAAGGPRHRRRPVSLRRRQQSSGRQPAGVGARGRPRRDGEAADRSRHAREDQGGILQPSTTWENQYLGSGGAAGILVSAVGRAELKKYQGRTLDDIAKAERKDPLDVLIDIIASDDTTGSGIMFFMDEDDVRAALKHPLVMLGTDSGGMAPDSPPPTAGVHPRAWGSAARILGEYVREERLLSLRKPSAR